MKKTLCLFWNDSFRYAHLRFAQMSLLGSRFARTSQLHSKKISSKCFFSLKILDCEQSFTNDFCSKVKFVTYRVNQGFFLKRAKKEMCCCLVEGMIHLLHILSMHPCIASLLAFTSATEFNHISTNHFDLIDRIPKSTQLCSTSGIGLPPK